LFERFWRYVGKGKPSECWIWQGATHDMGYGLIRGEPPARLMLRAHRVAWEMMRGPIPAGLECDHICRNRLCVNPDHLELVTHRTNSLRGISPPAINARKTHCPNGHLYDATNTYISPEGSRQCMTCRRDYQRMLRARRRRR
jgi:hypothetical protein